MIRTRVPQIDVAELERRIGEELEREPGPGGDARMARLAAAVHARMIEAQLDRAEERSTPRTSWPAELRVPGLVPMPLRSFILRLLALAFRDQHQVNAALIRSQREALALAQTLLDRLEALEARVGDGPSAPRAERSARRGTENPE